MERELLILILQLLLANPLIPLGNGDSYCKHCGAFYYAYGEPFKHNKDCVWLQAIDYAKAHELFKSDPKDGEHHEP